MYFANQEAFKCTFWLPRGHFSSRFGSQEGTLACVFQQMAPPLCTPLTILYTDHRDVSVVTTIINLCYGSSHIFDKKSGSFQPFLWSPCNKLYLMRPALLFSSRRQNQFNEVNHYFIRQAASIKDKTNKHRKKKKREVYGSITYMLLLPRYFSFSPGCLAAPYLSTDLPVYPLVCLNPSHLEEPVCSSLV